MKLKKHNLNEEPRDTNTQAIADITHQSKAHEEIDNTWFGKVKKEVSGWF